MLLKVGLQPTGEYRWVTNPAGAMLENFCPSTYRLYYGLADGTCTVRYDNEYGKGDHKHINGVEESYQFTDVETLVMDFLADIAKSRIK